MLESHFKTDLVDIKSNTNIRIVEIINNWLKYLQHAIRVWGQRREISKKKKKSCFPYPEKVQNAKHHNRCKQNEISYVCVAIKKGVVKVNWKSYSSFHEVESIMPVLYIYSGFLNIDPDAVKNVCSMHRS